MDLAPPPSEDLTPAEIKRLKRNIKKRRYKQHKEKEDSNKSIRKKELLKKLHNQSKIRQTAQQMQKYISQGVPSDTIRKIIQSI
jgi:hypothetical protein